MTRLEITGDGSHTLVHPELNETYHSRHGAIAESKHVFVDQGMAAFGDAHPDLQPLHIFEIGFGTGLNALLTLIHADRPVLYRTCEPFPVPDDILSQLNYSTQLQASDLWEKLHQTTWNQPLQVRPDYIFTKWNKKLEDLNLEQDFYHIVYLDAFSPKKAPDLWSETAIDLYFQILASNGTLVTYCSEGSFRRKLIATGFQVEKLPGPPGKREMVRAIKPA